MSGKGTILLYIDEYSFFAPPRAIMYGITRHFVKEVTGYNYFVLFQF